MPPYNIQKVENTKNINLEMADDGLSSNVSEQRLVEYEEGSTPPLGAAHSQQSSRMTKTQIVTVVVLCFVNLINYMDRFTVAGILPDIQVTFDNMSSAQAGLLQTAFVLVYMVMAPTFGYLGDRFNRTRLMAFGVLLWSLTTLIGSFMPNYVLFLVFRCMVGVGEASYSTIAPTIISDMFVKDQRSKMLAFFYFAIPVGSGLGYMVGAEVTNIAKSLMVAGDAWRWGLRVTPVMGIIAVFLIMFVMKEPPRGEVEGGAHLKPTNFRSDLKYLFTNKSYVLCTLAFTCVTFVAGALAWWGPTFVQLGVDVQEHPNVNPDNVSFVFGVIAMMAGLVGVPFGSFTGSVLRRRVGYADPLVCGVGLLLSCPLIVVGMLLVGTDTIAAYIVIFFGEIFLNLNWAVVSDIVLYVVIPTRRSSAEAFQILFSHALGDAGSPYLVGLVADLLKPLFRNSTGNVTWTGPAMTTPLFHESQLFHIKSSGGDAVTTVLTSTLPPVTTLAPDMDEKYAEFMALQASLYMCCTFLILGALFFFINCFFLTKDKERADELIRETFTPQFRGVKAIHVPKDFIELEHSSP